MSKQRFAPRSTLNLVVLSACLMAGSAQASLLGGSGGVGGALSPRGVDLSGRGDATLTRDGARVPGMTDKARDAVLRTRDAKAVVVDHAAGAKSGAASAGQAAAATGAATSASTLQNMTSTQADVSSQAGAAGQATTQAPAGTSAGSSTAADASTRNASVSKSGSASASRESRTVNASTSSDVSVSR